MQLKHMCQSHFTQADGEADVTQGSASHSCQMACGIN